MKKNYKKLTFKTKDEWLKAKEQTISGSEAAAICNKSKWLTADDIYNKMVLGKAKVIKENDLMHRGTLAEPLIRSLWGLTDKRFKIKDPPKRGYSMYVRKDKPYISCTPDGHAIRLSNNEKWGVEIKKVGLMRRADINAWEGNVLPDQYYYQVLQYMLVENDLAGVMLIAQLDYYKCESDNNWVVDYSVIRPFYITRKYVLGHLQYLEDKETNFYENNVRKKIRPKIVINFRK